MKKLFLTLTVLLMGVVACSKSGKDEKKETKETEIKQEVNKTTAVSSSSIKPGSSYETQISERMEAVKKEVQPALDSGVTADMNNAIQKLGDSWEAEMKKVYELLLSKLSERSYKCECCGIEIDRDYSWYNINKINREEDLYEKNAINGNTANRSNKLWCSRT